MAELVVEVLFSDRSIIKGCSKKFDGATRKEIKGMDNHIIYLERVCTINFCGFSSWNTEKKIFSGYLA